MGNDHLLLQGQRPLLSAVGRLPGTRCQSSGSSPFPSSRPQPRGKHSGPQAAWDQRCPDPGDAGEHPALTQPRRPIFPGAGAQRRLTQEPLFSGAPSASLHVYRVCHAALLPYASCHGRRRPQAGHVAPPMKRGVSTQPTYLAWCVTSCVLVAAGQVQHRECLERDRLLLCNGSILLLLLICYCA